MWPVWVLVVGIIGAVISCYTDVMYKFHVGVATGMIIALVVGFN